MRGADDFGTEFFDAFARAGDEREHRRSEALPERGEVDLVAVLGGDIHHVQRDERRVAEFEHLRGEVEVALEVRGIDDDHDERRRRHVRKAMKERIARDLFVERFGREAVGAGQIEDGDGRGRWRDQGADRSGVGV